MKILVCDDEPRQCERTRRMIEMYGDVEDLAGENLKHALKTFFGRISAALNDASIPDDKPNVEEFAGYDLAIVDNNLTGLELEGARLTAETIIGYLRAFTDIPYIVSLNKNPRLDFDLRDLFGDYQSLADLALNTRHLDKNCLWNSDAVTGFAPWYWPRLQEAVDRRKEQINSLDENLETSVWKALEFPPEADEYLSYGAKAALSASENQETRETTFEAFFEISCALPPAEKETLAKAKDAGMARQAMNRIASFEVDRWLRRDVLGPQDVLIDLPHLLAQMPFLLGEAANQLDAWNQVVRPEGEPFGLDETLFQNHLREARFAKSFWVPTPCFWWPSLKADDRLTELFFKAEGNWPDAVFCEDVSRFVQVSGDAERPQEFEAEIAGSWPRRFILDVDELQYSPRSRIVGSVT